jgi:serine/threonine-protein kinase
MSNSTSWKGKEVGNGRYRLTERLGEGGMGVVYRAWDKNLETDVVIKVPKCSQLGDDQFVRRFSREIQSLVKLAHPHIVTVLDVGKHDGVPFLVMQFLPGGNLKERQPTRADGQALPMPAATLGDWLPDIAQALDFMHRKSIIHRDIKPANILFDADNNVYLSDFGVAKALTSLANETGSSLTGTGMVFGTPGYMAPEVILGEPFDGRADQYALAITVHELMRGESPFEGLSLVQVAHQQKQGHPRPLDEIDPAIPRGLSRAVQTALSLEPGQRFPTCEAFARAALASISTVRTGTQANVPPALPRPTIAHAPMGLALECPVCQHSLKMQPGMEGKRVRCLQCRAILSVAGDLRSLKPASGPTPPVGNPPSNKPPGWWKEPPGSSPTVPRVATTTPEALPGTPPPMPAALQRRPASNPEQSLPGVKPALPPPPKRRKRRRRLMLVLIVLAAVLGLVILGLAGAMVVRRLSATPEILSTQIHRQIDVAM